MSSSPSKLTHQSGSPEWLAWLLLGAIILGYFSPYLFTGKTPLPFDLLSQMQPWSTTGKQEPQNWAAGDVIRQYIPWRALYREALTSGEIPFWNPYVFSGMPFLANGQSGIFYPPNLVFLIRDAAAAFLVFLLLHVLFSGLGMYLLLRRFELQPAAAVTGAVAWALCGYLSTWLLWITILATLTWLPWIFWAGDRAARQGDRASLAALSACLALMLLAGHLQFSYYACLALGAFLAWQVLSARSLSWMQRGRRAGWLAFSIILGLAITAVQLVPTFELAGFSGRDAEPIWRLIRATMPLKQLGTLLVPNLYGNVNHYKGAGNFTEFTGYVGLSSLLLALPLLFSPQLRKNRTAIFFLLLTLAALHLAYGGQLNRLVAMVPGYTRFRGLQRIYSLWSFGFAAVLAFSLQAILTSTGWQRRIQWVLGLALTLGGVFLLARLEWILGWFIRPRSRIPAFADAFLTPSWLVLAAGVLLLVIMVARQRAPRLVPYLAFLPALLVGTDLTLFARAYLPVAEASKPLSATPGVQYLQQHQSEGRLARFGETILNSPLPANTGILYGLQDVDGYDSFTLDAYNHLVGIAEPERYLYANQYNIIGNFQTPEALASPILDLLGTAFIITAEPLQKTPAGWELGYSGPDMSVYRNMETLPEAFLVKRAQVIPPGEAQYQVLGSPGFQPREEAVVDASLPAPLDPLAGGQVQIAQRTLNYLRLTVDVQAQDGQGALLVIRQNHFPGWQAQVDGKQAAIQTADLSFQSIFLTAGKHQVELRFVPRNFGLLAFISGSATVLCAALLISGVVTSPVPTRIRRQPLAPFQ